MAFALFKIPEDLNKIEAGFQLVLDDVRDPGNLGTLIRLCDWYGIKNLVCSKETVDCFNPKVVQATMGSLTRINLTYIDLPLHLAAQELPVYAAFMDGESVYKEELPQEAILILGNEANGISDAVAENIKHKISIPQFGQSTAESLNVAIAGAILVSEFKRS